MHNYMNKLGSFSREKRNGKKLPPSVILRKALSDLAAVDPGKNKQSSKLFDL